MKTTLYVYKIGNAYIKIGRTLKISLEKDINKSAYWETKTSANTWKSAVENKYPNAILVECGLCEIKK